MDKSYTIFEDTVVSHGCISYVQSWRARDNVDTVIVLREDRAKANASMVLPMLHCLVYDSSFTGYRNNIDGTIILTAD